jgi:DNA-binding MarR family transcriptional regulator
MPRAACLRLHFSPNARVRSAVPPGEDLIVVLTAEEAGMLRGLLRKLEPERGAAAGTATSLADLAARIHALLSELKRLLPRTVASEAECDMLLLLYCADTRGEQVTVTGLGALMGLPHATAARRIAALSKVGLVALQFDEEDRRRRFVALTPLAFEKVTSSLQLVQDGAAATRA